MLSTIKAKYLKYKNKYLNLKKSSNFYKTIDLIGGNKKSKKSKNKVFKFLKRSFNNYFEEMNALFPESFEDTTEFLEEILNNANVSKCHGIEHAKQVMYNAFKALHYEEYNINDEDKQAVLLAALLHDADDKKFFPEHNNYENLRKILQKNGKSDEFIEKVVYMVSIVSASKNGDNIPENVVGKEWMLIPRYADRLEAIGIIGVERCYTYNINVSKMPLYVDSTPIPKTEEDIWKEASEERYKKYNGNSVSMIDHYYDKLLRVSIFPIRNKFFDEECIIRRRPLIDLLLLFGNSGTITNEQIVKFIDEYNKDI